MDVTLLVYDLSQGLARQMSMGFLGFQLDAIYHTSIEVNGREYVYDGGIVAIVPGSSHLGQPMERIPLGTTALTMDVIEEYLESIRPLFTAEAYDLFHHNCNNFSDTFSNFLVGKGIPKHIASMPQAVLESPMGRMLAPQLMQRASAGRQQNGGALLGLGQSAQSAAPGRSTTPTVPATTRPGTAGTVKNVSTPAELARLLDEAKSSCAAIFFTSATCPPCKVLYPVYDQLAQELQGQITLIKVDVALPQAQPIAAQYAVHATPTFVTFLQGTKERQWSGADAAQLRSNLQLLATMAQGRRHLHETLRLPSFAQPAGAPAPHPVLYPKVPPLEKLVAKLGDAAAKKLAVQALTTYLAGRATASALGSVAVPPLNDLASLITTSADTMAPETLFAVVDLFRCSLTDPRIGGFFAEEAGHKTARAVVASVVARADCPYALRLVTLQTACNLFSTPLFAEELAKDAALRSLLVQLVSSSFLDDSHTSVRVAAASLLFNIALAHQAARRRASRAPAPSVLSGEDEVELAASVVEAIAQEETSADALRGMLLALGHLVYCAPLDGDLADLLRALDASGTILGKKTAFPTEPLIDEVGSELLQHGLRRE